MRTFRLLVASCPEEHTISEFARADLVGPEREAVEAHLDECPACALVVAELVRVFTADRRRESDEFPLSGDLDETVAGEPCEGAAPRTLASGDSVGRYRVLDVVGAGNMGVVYAAYDPELDRRVALKLLRFDEGAGSSGSGDGRGGRLQREAQALARLSHPNVIAVHDVGTFEGRVFVAMEFVEGGTLTQWLGERSRSWEEIRAAFVSAGEGLAAAHAAGMVHRDFKPDNVLIGRDGRVRVTDFGLARLETGSTLQHPVVAELTDSKEVGTSLAMTATGAMVGTPAYMAPEQFERGTVDALSDQFSFCVALYEAIWGSRPFSGSTLAELAAKVVEGRHDEPPRDSRVPVRVRRAVLRGLSRDRSRRFGDMKALLGELSHRSRAWRRAVWLGVPISVTLAGASMLDRSGPRTVSDFCEGEPMPGVWDAPRITRLRAGFEEPGVPHAAQTWAVVQERVDAWVSDWSEQRREVCGPELAASALASLRTICLERKRDELAVTLSVLERPDAQVVTRAPAVASALPLLEPCAEPGRHAEREPTPPPSELEPDVAQLRVREAQVKAMLLAGRFAEAVEVAEALREDAEALGYEPMFARAQRMVGRAYSYDGREDESTELLFDAMYRAIAAGDRRVAIETLVELVYVVGHQHLQIEAAERLAALAEAEIRALGDEPEMEAVRLMNLGTTYVTVGREADALELMNRAWAIRKEVGSELQKADLLLNIATIEMLLLRFDDAEQHFEQARARYAEAFGEDHPVVADARQNYAQMLVMEGRSDEAIEVLEQARVIRARAWGEEHPEYAKTLSVLAEAKSAQGKHDQAIALQRQALDISLGVHDAGHPRALLERTELVEILAAAGRLEDAEAEARQAFELAQELGPVHSVRITAVSHLGDVLVLQERWKEALATFAETERLLAEAGRTDDPVLAPVRMQQAQILQQLGRHAQMAEVLRSAIPLAQKHEAAGYLVPTLQLLLAQARYELGEDRPSRLAEVRAALATLRDQGDHERVESAEQWLLEHSDQR